MLSSEIVARAGGGERNSRTGCPSSESRRVFAADFRDSIPRSERPFGLEISPRQGKSTARGVARPTLSPDEQQAVNEVRNAVAGLNDALAKAAAFHIEVDLSGYSMVTANSRAKCWSYSGAFTCFSEERQVRGVIE